MLGVIRGMAGGWLGDGWGMAGGWLGDGWGMAGGWLGDGWGMAGGWLGDGWGMAGGAGLRMEMGMAGSGIIMGIGSGMLDVGDVENWACW